MRAIMRTLEPVWGALDDNEPSMRMAARLSFEPVRRIVAFVAPRDAPRFGGSGVESY